MMLHQTPLVAKGEKKGTPREPFLPPKARQANRLVDHTGFSLAVEGVGRSWLRLRHPASRRLKSIVQSYPALLAVRLLPFPT